MPHQILIYHPLGTSKIENIELDNHTIAFNVLNATEVFDTKQERLAAIRAIFYLLGLNSKEWFVKSEYQHHRNLRRL